MQETFNILPVFRRSLSVLWRRAPILLSLGALVHIPVLVYSASGQVMEEPGDDIRLLSLVLSMLMLGAVSFATVSELKGGRTNFFRCLAVAVGQMFPILGVGLLIGIFPLVLSYYPSLLAALLLPWILVTTLLYAAIPVVVAEQRGVRASLVRSAQLTYGRKWRIFTILALLGILKMVSADLVERVLGSEPSTQAVLAHLAVDVLVEVYAAVVAAVTYVSLLRSFQER